MEKRTESKGGGEEKRNRVGGGRWEEGKNEKKNPKIPKAQYHALNSSPL